MKRCGREKMEIRRKSGGDELGTDVVRKGEERTRSARREGLFELMVVLVFSKHHTFSLNHQNSWVLVACIPGMKLCSICREGGSH